MHSLDWCLCRRGTFPIAIGLLLASTLSACRMGTSTQVPPPVGTTEVITLDQAAQETGGVSPGDSTHALTHDGLERTYLMHVPPGYDATRPTAVVLAYHGFGLRAEEMARISKLSEQADASGFIVIYPNGTGESSSWNGGHCCGEAAAKSVDDVDFTRALLDELDTIINLDASRVYATGFSNGSLFAYELACQLSDRIAAIGPVGATQVRDDQEACHPARSVPVIHFHGTADRLNPYDGATNAAGFEFLSVKDAITHWVEANGCPAGPQHTESGSIEHDMYSPCSQGASVELYTIVGGEHAWPGGEAVTVQIGEPTMEISASALMWEFFAEHPMP